MGNFLDLFVLHNTVYLFIHNHKHNKHISKQSRGRGERWRNTLEMRTEETQEYHMQTQTDSGTSGLVPLLSPLLLGATLTCGNLLINGSSVSSPFLYLFHLFFLIIFFIFFLYYCYYYVFVIFSVKFCPILVASIFIICWGLLVC